MKYFLEENVCGFFFTGNGPLLPATLPARKHLLNHVPRFEDEVENDQLQSYWKARGRHKNGSFSSVMYLAALVVVRRRT